MMAKDKIFEFVSACVEGNDDVLTDAQFREFIKLCRDAKKTPLSVFMDKAFMGFNADDCLKQAIALFCLTPKTRDEMTHILFLSAPGEGQNYLIDKVIQPMVKCGKVSTETTTAAFIGAMSSADLRALGTGVLQQYHNERLAVSEIQAWHSMKIQALLAAMNEGKVRVSKGKTADVVRPACENVMVLGNILPGEDMGSMITGKNKQYAKQIMSKFSVIIAKPSLMNVHSESLAKKMFLNIDDARHDKQTAKQTTWHRFFGRYFRYVSSLPVRVTPSGDAIYRALKTMANNPELAQVIYAETGKLEKRKVDQFANLCRSFAKIQGRKKITGDDIHNAESLYSRSFAPKAKLKYTASIV